MKSKMKIAGRRRPARSPRLRLPTTRSARLRMPGLGGRKDPRGARERPQRPLSVVNQGLLPNCVVEQNGPLRPPKVLPGAAPSPRGARKPWDGASVDGEGRADLRKVVVHAEVSIVHLSPQTDTTHPNNSQCNTHHQGWSIFGHQPGEELLHLPVTSPQLPAVSAAKRSSFPVPATVIVVHVVLLPRPSAMKGCAAVCVLLRRS